jgi:uncharacterized protein YjiS (DUF1127 family)
MITTYGAAGLGQATTSTRRVSSFLTRSWGAIQEECRRRKLRAKLCDLNDRELRDIGLRVARSTTSPRIVLSTREVLFDLALHDQRPALSLGLQLELGKGVSPRPTFGCRTANAGIRSIASFCSGRSLRSDLTPRNRLAGVFQALGDTGLDIWRYRRARNSSRRRIAAPMRSSRRRRRSRRHRGSRCECAPACARRRRAPETHPEARCRRSTAQAQAPAR